MISSLIVLILFKVQGGISNLHVFKVFSCEVQSYLVKHCNAPRISLLPKLAIHRGLPSAACMRDARKVSLLYTHLHSVHLYWWKRQV